MPRRPPLRPPVYARTPLYDAQVASLAVSFPSQPVVSHLMYSGVPLHDAVHPVQPASTAFWFTAHFDPHWPLYMRVSMFNTAAQLIPLTMPEHPEIVHTSVLGASAGAGAGPHVATYFPSASSTAPILSSVSDTPSFERIGSTVYRVPSHVAPQFERIWTTIASVSSALPTFRLS